MKTVLLLLLAPAALVFCAVGIFLHPAVFFSEQPSFLQKLPKEHLLPSLKQHVRVLADDIGERHFQQPDALTASSDYIRARFAAAGYTTRKQTYANGYHNIIAELPGHDTSAGIIIVGAHYDTVWHSPGADDNASGIAALLEIARVLVSVDLEHTLRFVAFTNEEQPFSETAEMGSRVYANSLQAGDEKVRAMFSLEMLGYYSDVAGSQRYPPPLQWFYPDTADFIGFVANPHSTGLLLQSLRQFRKADTFPARGLFAPESLVRDIRRSDHAAFWDAGIPALMITDTANFRNPNYHTLADTPETLDYESMTRVVIGLAVMFQQLAVPR